MKYTILIYENEADFAVSAAMPTRRRRSSGRSG
jgi:hypothetical protein